jgi:YbbR domain-containing protein
VNTDTDRVILATSLPQQVLVRFSGQGKTLARLRLSDRRLVVDVTEKFKQPRASHTLRTDQVHIPGLLVGSVEVMEIVEPKSIEFELDRPFDKKVEVIPQADLRCAKGFVQVGPIRVAPDHVTLSGPAQFVAPVESVFLDSVRLQQVKDDVIREVPVILPEGVNVSCVPPSAKMIANVQELGERTFALLPVAVQGGPHYTELRSEPPVVTMKVTGGVELLSTLKPSDFKVTVDYEQWLRQGKQKIPPTVEFPPYVNFEALPDSFTLVTVR